MNPPTPPDADELVRLDALFADRADGWWSAFYRDRSRACPFFTHRPDESLAGWVGQGLISPCRALDLGCGHGRHAIWLAGAGFEAEGLDHSREAIDWAAQCSAEAGVAVRWRCESLFDADLGQGAYGLVVDSGCFHHLPPHRRSGYVALVWRALAPGGWLALTCFASDAGSGYTDEQVYERRSLGGGLGYGEDSLRALWSPGFAIDVLRPMQAQAADSPWFGEAFLQVMLARKRV